MRAPLMMSRDVGLLGSTRRVEASAAAGSSQKYWTRRRPASVGTENTNSTSSPSKRSSDPVPNLPNDGIEVTTMESTRLRPGQQQLALAFVLRRVQPPLDALLIADALGLRDTFE